MKTPLPLLLVLVALALLSIGGRSNLGAAAEGAPETGRLGDLERRVARIETHLGRDALGWRNSGTVAKRLETLERQAKEAGRDKQPSFQRKMNPAPDWNRLAVDLRSLRHDFESLERKVRDQSSQMSRTRNSGGSDSSRREIERMRREVEKLRNDVQRLDRR